MVKIQKLEEAISKLELQSKVQDVSPKKIKSLMSILEWAHKKGHISENIFNSWVNRLNKLGQSKSESLKIRTTQQISGHNPFIYIIPILILCILLPFAYFAGNKAQTVSQTVAPSEISRVGKTFRFQGTLLDQEGNPINRKVDVTFKLYTSELGGKVLYEGKCIGKNALIPKLSGKVSIMIGSDCGMQKIPESVFGNNQNIYLGVTVGKNKELLPRYPVNTIDYAKNASKVNGLSLGGDESSIPYIDEEGRLVLGAVSPVITSTEGNFTLEGETILIKTNPETAGSIMFEPDPGGNVIVRTGKLGVGKENPSSAIDLEGDLSLTGKVYLEGANSSFYQNNGGIISFYSDKDINDLSQPVFQIRGGEDAGIDVGGNLLLVAAKPKIATLNNNDLLLGDKNTGNIIIEGNKNISIGTSQIGEGIVIGKDVSPNKNADLDLGSATRKWHSIYAGDLFLDNEGIGGFWQRKGSNIMPTNIQDDIILGSTTGQSSTIKLSGKSGATSWITGGFTGIGTRTPHFQFSALGNNSQGAVASLSNISPNDNGSTGVLRLQLGTNTSGTNAKFVEFYAGARDDNNGSRMGSIRLNNNGVVYETRGADFAEYILLNEDVDTGFIVGAGKWGKGVAKKGDTLLGVVSDTAGFVGNAKNENKENEVLVGLVGQVKTYLSTENGPISTGDIVSVGSIPGIGVKSNGKSTSIGVVLDSADEITKELSPLQCPKEYKDMTDPNGNPLSCGRITVLIQPHSPSPQLDTLSKGTVTIPKGQVKGRVFIDTLTDDSSIQLTALSENPITTSVSKKNVCPIINSGCQNYFEVVSNKTVDTTVQIQWVVIN